MLQIELGGQCALVTGAGRGLGLAIVRALHGAGAYVAVHDRTPEAVQGAIAALGGGARLVPAPSDLALDDGPALAVSQAIRLLGRLDILVNNAAIRVDRGPEELDDELWDRSLAVDLRAPFFTAQAALPHLKESSGTILNIGAGEGLAATGRSPAYVAAEHGLVALTRALAVELAPEGVRVFAICPGGIDSERTRELAEMEGGSGEIPAALIARHPLGRLAWPEELAALVLCLLSPAAAFLAGSALAVDGGRTAAGG